MIKCIVESSLASLVDSSFLPAAKELGPPSCKDPLRFRLRRHFGSPYISPCFTNNMGWSFVCLFIGRNEFDPDEDAHVVGDCVKVLVGTLFIFS